MNTLEIVSQDLTSIEVSLGVPLTAGAVTGAYGAFYDVTDQTLVSAGAAKIINIGQESEANHVSIEDGNKLTFARAGVYNIQYSVQFTNSANETYIADIWLSKNNTRVEDSNSRFSVPARKGQINGHLISAVNYILSLNAGDYLQLEWTAENTAVFIDTVPASNGYPRTPGIILTAQQVMLTQAAPSFNISNPQNGDILVYSNGQWINEQP